MDKDSIQKAADLFVEARKTGNLLEELPEACRPANFAEANAIQAVTCDLLGEDVVGWKAMVIDGEMMRGNILGSRLLASPAKIAASVVPLLGIEAEIAFRFDRDLPPRSDAYSEDEIADAVTALVTIEIVDSRYTDYAGAELLNKAADCVSNGALVTGTENPDWRSVDLSKIEVDLAIDGKSVVHNVGGHVLDTPVVCLVALVNDMRSTDGVKAGQYVTAGSYTGIIHAKPGQHVVAEFLGFGSAEVQLEA